MDGFGTVFAPLVKQMWQAPPSDATAVCEHRGVTRISKHHFYVLIWICNAKRLQLSNEARGIQQEVRRKSTQELLRGMTHAHFRLVTGLIVPRDETPRTQCDANKSRSWVDDRSIAVAECS